MSSKARHSCIAALATMLFVVVGCGGSSSSEKSSAPPPAATPTAVSAPAGGKVSANTASQEEITAALEAAGVKNSERWAHEVVEYRPYPSDDPDLTKLRENLAKYNPGEETVNRIVSALTP